MRASESQHSTVNNQATTRELPKQHLLDRREQGPEDEPA
jgi:hypothetical protein